MSKTDKTIYTCDRCGKEIASTPYTIATARFIRLMRWWAPQDGRYKNVHLCQKCWGEFEGFMRGDVW